MDDATPRVLAFAPLAWDSASAARRIAQLETALLRRGELLEQKQLELESIQCSVAWKACRWYYKVREKILPLHSRRRRCHVWAMKRVGGLLRAACKRATGRDLYDPDALLDGDRLALDDAQYAAWIRSHEPKPAVLARLRKQTHEGPQFSLGLDASDAHPSDVTASIHSLSEQIYRHWEVRIGITERTPAATVTKIEDLARTDCRVSVCRIAGDSRQPVLNAVLREAAGEWYGWLQPGDCLSPRALLEVSRCARSRPEIQLVYSDEDILTSQGKRVRPLFKPDWSPDTLRSQNYVSQFMAVRHSMFERLEGIRSNIPGAEDYDFVLRVGEQTREIAHIAQVLYHRKETEHGTQESQQRTQSGCQVLQAHLDRSRTPATVQEGPFPETYRVSYLLPRQPLVSVLIPNRDAVDMLARCVESVEQSSYANYEILVLENHSSQEETLAYYRQIEKRDRIRIIPWHKPFNYAAINNYGATRARGEILLFLNNDIESIHPDWLEEMVKNALRPEIGAVGAKLLFADDTIQHAGIVIGMGGVAGHVHVKFPRDAEGYMHRLWLAHNCAAVTGACLMTRAEVFAEVGGFDEGFVLAYNDVDLCLQIHAQGYHILWTPAAELYHLESKTRGLEDTPAKLARYAREYHLFRAKWPQYLQFGDPYYNPNFRLDRANYALRA